MLKVNIDKQITRVNIEQVVKESIIKYGDRYEKPEPLVKVIKGVTENVYLNYSGMSAVYGRQKSRKTFFLTNVMACAIGNIVLDDKLRAYTYGKKHFWFDTEQSKYYASLINYRICKKLGLNSHPENFELYSIKRYMTEDRIDIINHIIEKNDNIGLVIIDGIRDLVKDFNNLTECTEIINRLMTWVDTKNCHIATVLHINPIKGQEDYKPRGHLGTELQNKIESSVVLEKIDKTSSKVMPRDFRDRDISDFDMRIDDSGIPHFIESIEELPY